MKLETRIKIERQIVRAILTQAVRWGYYFRIDNGEDYTKRLASVEEGMKAAFATDEEKIILYRNDDGVFTPIGSIFLVYGNGGYDVICD